MGLESSVKTIDWYILTYLPLLVLSIILFMSLLVKGWGITLRLATEQLLMFSLLLSTSDLAKRATYSTDDKVTSRLLPLITIVLSAGFLFIYVAINIMQESFWKHYLFLFLAMTTTIFSLIFYYKNPINGQKEASDYVEDKTSQEEKDLLNFEGGEK